MPAAEHAARPIDGHGPADHAFAARESESIVSRKRAGGREAALCYVRAMGRRRGLAAGLAVIGLSVVSVRLADATTGSTNGFPQPKATVPASIAEPFTGRYVLSEVGRSARLRNGEVKIDFSESSSPEFLVGVAQFYGYDADGRQAMSLDAMYPFSWSHGRLHAPVLSQGLTQVRLGSVTLQTPKSETELHGQMTLGGHTFPITLRRLADGATVGGDPPAAKRIADHPAPTPTTPGWGASPSAFVGRYRLTNPVADQSASAGVLAPVVRAVQDLGGSGASPSAGQLSVSSGGAAGTATGLLKLDAVGQPRTYALTGLTWRGARRAAQVRAGGPSGAVVGTFTATAKGERLSGTLQVGGDSTTLNFRRVSPTP
jgi:hypothetical protein